MSLTSPLNLQQVGEDWHKLSPDQRKHWEDMAREEKERHKAAYPDYRYSPMFKKDGSAPANANAGSVVRRKKGGLTSPVMGTEELRRTKRAALKGRTGGAKLDADDESDDGSDFELSMAAARKRRSKKRSGLVPPPAFVHDATYDFIPAGHHMTTRRRSSSTPSHPPEHLLAGPSNSGRRRSHIRTLSDQSSYPSQTKSTKPRITNNSLSTMATDVKVDEPIFSNPLAYGQRRVHNKRLDFEQMCGVSTSPVSCKT